jgi:rabenosyn-5
MCSYRSTWSRCRCVRPFLLFVYVLTARVQAIPTSKKAKSPDEQPQGVPSSSAGPHALDPNSAAAHALQPLLEQEALLETFVHEAKASRKFEDVRTLKANLAEIRSEIDRIMVNVNADARAT